MNLLLGDPMVCLPVSLHHTSLSFTVVAGPSIRKPFGPPKINKRGLVKLLPGLVQQSTI